MNWPDGRKPVFEVVDDETAAVLRRMSGWERLKIVNALYRAAWKRIEESIRHDHPDWDEQRVRRAVAQRIAAGFD